MFWYVLGDLNNITFNVLLETKKTEELGDVQLGHLPSPVSGYSNGEYS